MLSLQEAKEFLRVDHDEEDASINGLLQASEGYIINAIGVKEITDDRQKELFKLAQKLLIAHWYENREVIGKTDKAAFSLSSILVQLQYAGGDSQ